MGLMGDIAGAAGGLLGSGGPGAPAPVKNEPMTFKEGPAIDPPEGNVPGSTAPNSYLNVFDVSQPIQFIHFGKVHVSVCNLFPHDQLADDNANALKDAGVSIRGFQFRAALEREALLMHGFIRAAQRVVEERKNSSSDVEAVANMAASLMGGGASGPQPQNFDPYLDLVTKPGGTINKVEIKYKDVHLAGKDFHQARTNFNANMPKLLTDAMGSSGANPLGNLTSAIPLPSVPGVGNILKTVMDILFKMFEIHSGTYAKLREKMEPAIEEACHARTLAAIREPRAPVFDVWSIVPPEAEAQQEDKLIGMDDTGVEPVDDAVGTVNKTYSDIKKGIADAKKAWEEFWKIAPDPGPGEEQIRSIFKAIDKPGDLFAEAFASAIGINKLPDFLKWPLNKIINAEIGMLEAVFVSMQDPVVAQQMDDAALMAAGRQYVEDTIRGVLLDLIPGFQIGPASNKWAAGKTASAMDDFLGDKIEPVLEAAMGCLVAEFATIKASLKDKNAHTLEPYLADAPLMLALMVRNTFFPIWQLIVDEVLGSIGAGAAAAASPVRNVMNSARGFVSDTQKKASDLNQDIKDKATGTANDIKDKEKSVQDDIKKQTMGVGGIDTPLGGAADGLAGAVGGLSDSILGSDAAADAAGGGGKFPGDKRESNGKANEIKGSEWKDVQDNQAVTPAPTPSNEAAPAPATA